MNRMLLRCAAASVALLICALVVAACSSRRATAPTHTTGTTAAQSAASAAAKNTARPLPTATPAKPPFDPGHADELAHAAILDAASLPGGGWVIDATDQFEDDTDFDSIPACHDFADHVGASGASGHHDDLAGHAKTEFKRPNSDPNSLELPPSVEVEVEIYHTPGEAAVPWSVVQNIIDSPQFSDCIAAVGEQALAGAPEGLTGGFSTAKTNIKLPQNGAQMGMKGNFKFVGLSFDLVGGVFFWTYGNAQVTTTIFGSPSAITPAFVSQVLAQVDRSVQAAGKS